MAAGQRDIPVLLQPGNGATVRAPGEFLYLKFADREIQAIVTGLDGTQSRVKMVTGDFTRPGGGISEVELVNPDPANACAVVVTVGDGEFDRKIIQGDVSITPVIRTANGQTRNDSRRTISLDVSPQYQSTHDWEVGDLLAENPDPGASSINDMVTAADTYFGYAGNRFIEFDPQTLRRVSTSPETATATGVPVDMGHPSVLHPMVGDRSGIVYAVDRASSFGSGPSRLIVVNPRTGLVSGQFDVGSSSRIPTGMIVAPGFDQVVIAMNASSGPREFWIYNLSTGAFVGLDQSLDANFNLGSSYEVEPGKWYTVEDGDSLWTVKGSPGNWSISAQRATGISSVNANAVAVGLFALAKGQVGATPYPVRKYAMAPFTTVSGVAALAGCGTLFNRLVKRRALDGAAQSIAAVEVTWQDRRGLARGEIIRLIIEWYTGELAPDDYLDHVYGARLFRPTDNSAERAVMTGAETFAKAGIADDFEIYLPARVELIVDNELATSPLF